MNGTLRSMGFLELTDSMEDAAETRASQDIGQLTAVARPVLMRGLLRLELRTVARSEDTIPSN